MTDWADKELLTSTKPNQIGDNRQPDGKFGPGNVANPAGRPPGSLSLIAILKEELSKVPEGQKHTAAYLLIQRMLKSAISDGNDQQIKNILQYVEGMPKQSMDITSDNKPIPLLGGIVDLSANDRSQENNSNETTTS
jgi:hypothetical protein